MLSTLYKKWTREAVGAETQRLHPVCKRKQVPFMERTPDQLHADRHAAVVARDRKHHGRKSQVIHKTHIAMEGQQLARIEIGTCRGHDVPVRRRMRQCGDEEDVELAQMLVDECPRAASTIDT